MRLRMSETYIKRSCKGGRRQKKRNINMKKIKISSRRMVHTVCNYETYKVIGSLRS